MDHWFSAQLRQYRLQFVRAFSGFSVKTGKKGANNTEELIRVPAWYGDPSYIAASIIKGNSDNKAPAVPFISCYISSLNMNASRRQDPQLVEKVQVNVREYDEESGHYTSKLGNRVSVERHMPVPYDLTFQVDIWTNNLDIKEQLLEQILVLYNPAIDIQTSTNPIDWTTLTYIEMMDNINWSSRNIIPGSSSQAVDVATLYFKTPIWINPPAKIRRQNLIQQIVTNITEGSSSELYSGEFSSNSLLSRTITTPENAIIYVTPNIDGTYNLSLRDSSGNNKDPQNLPTVTQSAPYPSISPGSKFRWNDIECTLIGSDINSVVNNLKKNLIGSNLNCDVVDNSIIQFINTSGGSNTFMDITQGTLYGLGLKETTYEGSTLAWWRLLSLYGTPRTYQSYGINASQIRLKNVENIDNTESDIIGWIDFDKTNQNILKWTPDNQINLQITIDPISSIIDPTANGPNIGLPSASVGQRYLLTNSIPNQSQAWGNIVANEGDIISFNGSSWYVAWKALDHINITATVLNTKTNRIYKWYNNYWSPIINSKYLQGFWRISI